MLILPGSFCACNTLCFHAFPGCCIWFPLSLSCLFLFSRSPFPFLSFYLLLVFTYLYVLPLASFAPPILCLLFVEAFFFPHPRLLSFSINARYSIIFSHFFAFSIKTHFLSYDCSRKQFNVQFTSMHNWNCAAWMHTRHNW